jgi:GntR family transcriptional regulator
MLLGRDAAEPLWMQVSRLLAEQIANGVIRSGSRLPSERELCERLDVSRVTVRRALRELAREGLVRQSSTRGWFVAGARLAEPPNVLQSLTSMAEARGFAIATHVLALVSRAAQLDEAEELRIVPGAPVADLERLRRLDGIPFAVDASVLPLARFPGLLETELEDRSLYATLEERFGAVATRADYALDADRAASHDAALLEIEPGSPVLVARQITFDQHGEPFELGRIVYPAGRYRFRATLIKPPIASQP